MAFAGVILHLSYHVLQAAAHLDSAASIGVLARLKYPNVPTDMNSILGLDMLVLKVREVVRVICLKQVSFLMRLHFLIALR